MRRWMLALGFALVVPAPFASAQEQVTDAAPSAAEAKTESPAPEPAATPSKAAVQPAAAEAPPTLGDVQPASAKRKRKRSAEAQQAEKPTEETIKKLPVPSAPAGTEVPSPEEQKKVAEGVANGLIDSGKDLPAAPTAAQMTDKQAVEANAREFFFSIMNGDARAIMLHSVVPFALEDRRIATEDELFQEWLRHLRSKRTDLLVLYGVQVLTPEEMEKAYGKPPSRLGNFPWKNGKTFIAVGNLSGHAAIALFRETRPGDFAVAGYTD